MGTSFGNMIGLAGEFRVMSELLLRGHNPAKSYLEDGADLILENNIRIEVKSCHINKRSCGNGYPFGFYKKGGKADIAKKFDFAICWCIDDDCFYIIPRDKLPTAAVLICDVSDNARHKYTAYKNKWELLNKEVSNGNTKGLQTDRA